MSIVARSAQHGIFPVDFLWKQYAVSVEGQKGVLALEELLEIKCVSDSNSRAVVAITPGYPIAVFYPRHSWVVFIVRINHFRVSRLKLNRVVLYVPMDAIFAESCENVHLHGFVVTAEYSGKAIPKRHYCAVENAV